MNNQEIKKQYSDCRDTIKKNVKAIKSLIESNNKLVEIYSKLEYGDIRENLLISTLANRQTLYDMIDGHIKLFKEYDALIDLLNH